MKSRQRVRRRVSIARRRSQTFHFPIPSHASSYSHRFPTVPFTVYRECVCVGVLCFENQARLSFSASQRESITSNVGIKVCFPQARRLRHNMPSLRKLQRSSSSWIKDASRCRERRKGSTERSERPPVESSCLSSNSLGITAVLVLITVRRSRSRLIVRLNVGILVWNLFHPWMWFVRSFVRRKRRWQTHRGCVLLSVGYTERSCMVGCAEL